MWIAAAHVAGSLFAALAVAVAALMVGVWLGNRTAATTLEDVKNRLGFTEEDLENHEKFRKAMSLLYERYSSERLSNRISDICGLLQRTIDWAVLLIQLAILGSVIWFISTDSPDNAIYAWVIPAISLLLFIERMVFGFICHVLTGRRPGQAKSSKKAIADLLKTIPRPDPCSSQDNLELD